MRCANRMGNATAARIVRIISNVQIIFACANRDSLRSTDDVYVRGFMDLWGLIDLIVLVLIFTANHPNNSALINVASGLWINAILLFTKIIM